MIKSVLNNVAYNRWSRWVASLVKACSCRLVATCIKEVRSNCITCFTELFKMSLNNLLIFALCYTGPAGALIGKRFGIHVYQFSYWSLISLCYHWLYCLLGCILIRWNGYIYPGMSILEGKSDDHTHMEKNRFLDHLLFSPDVSWMIHLVQWSVTITGKPDSIYGIVWEQLPMMILLSQINVLYIAYISGLVGLLLSQLN